MRTVAAFLLFLGLMGFARPVGAQATQTELAEARAHFMAGEAAAESGRWDDAVESFSRSYDLAGVPHALYNRAYALRALGRHLEARDAFAELLLEHPDFDRALRRDARRFRAEAETRIAVLNVDGLDPDRTHQVRIDGRSVADDGERPLPIEADGGSHTVTIRADGFQPFVWEGEVEDGQRLSVDADLRPVRSDGPRRNNGNGGLTGNGDPQPIEEDEEGGVLSSPWFWVTVLGVLAIGGGVTAYLIHDVAQLDPMSNRVIELD